MVPPISFALRALPLTAVDLVAAVVLYHWTGPVLAAVLGVAGALLAGSIAHQLLLTLREQYRRPPRH